MAQDLISSYAKEGEKFVYTCLKYLLLKVTYGLVHCLMKLSDFLSTLTCSVCRHDQTILPEQAPFPYPQQTKDLISSYAKKGEKFVLHLFLTSPLKATYGVVYWLMKFSKYFEHLELKCY